MTKFITDSQEFIEVLEGLPVSEKESLSLKLGEKAHKDIVKFLEKIIEGTLEEVERDFLYPGLYKVGEFILLNKNELGYYDNNHKYFKTFKDIPKEFKGFEQEYVVALNEELANKKQLAKQKAIEQFKQLVEKTEEVEGVKLTLYNFEKVKMIEDGKGYYFWTECKDLKTYKTYRGLLYFTSEEEAIDALSYLKDEYLGS